MASTIVSALRDGRLPPSGSSGRTILAIFMAVQIARNLTIMPPLGYYSELFDTFESLQVGTEDVRSYLTRAYGFTPAISEVEAATRVAEIGASTFLSTDDLKDFMLTTLFKLRQGASSVPRSSSVVPRSFQTSRDNNVGSPSCSLESS